MAVSRVTALAAQLLLLLCRPAAYAASPTNVSRRADEMSALIMMARTATQPDGGERARRGRLLQGDAT